MVHLRFYFPNTATSAPWPNKGYRAWSSDVLCVSGLNFLYALQLHMIRRMLVPMINGIKWNNAMTVSDSLNLNIMVIPIVNRELI